MNASVKLLLTFWLSLLYGLMWLYLYPESLPPKIAAGMLPANAFAAMAGAHTIFLVLFLIPIASAQPDDASAWAAAFGFGLAPALLMTVAGYLGDVWAVEMIRVCGFQAGLALALCALARVAPKDTAALAFASGVCLFLAAGFPLMYYAQLEFAAEPSRALLLASPVAMTSAMLHDPEKASDAARVWYVCMAVIVAAGLGWSAWRARRESRIA